MTASHTPAQVRDRLLQIADDPTWHGIYRSMAKYAARPDAADRGFDVDPADLSDDTIRAVLAERLTRRHVEDSRTAVPDDPDTLRRNLQNLIAGAGRETAR